MYVDIDECLTNNGECAQICNNTDGSFECLCDEDYALAADGFGCDGKRFLGAKRGFANPPPCKFFAPLKLEGGNHSNKCNTSNAGIY